MPKAERIYTDYITQKLYRDDYEPEKYLFRDKGDVTFNEASSSMWFWRVFLERHTKDSIERGTDTDFLDSLELCADIWFRVVYDITDPDDRQMVLREECTANWNKDKHKWEVANLCAWSSGWEE